MSDKYILEADGRTPNPTRDLMEWGRWFQANNNRVVKLDEIGGVKVSTVFLGLDHRFGNEGEPILWETMIFGGEHNDYQERYSTFDDAVAGHAKAVALVKGKNQ